MLDVTRPAPMDPWVGAWAQEIPRLLSGIANAVHSGRMTEPILHRSRRELKRLRSLLRLAPRSCTVLAEETRKSAGELRRRLGDARDATVMQHTLHAFADELGETATRINAVLSSHRRNVGSHLDRSPRRAEHDRIVRLSAVWRGRAARGNVADLCLEAVKTYRRARRRARALAKGETAALHALRKVVVDHQNHLAFFAMLAEGEIASRHKKIKRLREELGECHDLEVLRDFVRTRADISAGDLVRLEEVLAKRHRRRIGKAGKRVSGLFDEKPHNFAKWLQREIEKATKTIEAAGPPRLATGVGLPRSVDLSLDI